VVAAVVTAAGLGTRAGSRSHHPGDRGQRGVFEAAARRDDSRCGGVEVSEHLAQSRVVAHDGRVPGHGLLQLRSRQHRALRPRRVDHPGRAAAFGVFGGRHSGSPAHHEPFEQAVGREPVRPVHPGAGDLPCGEQAGHRGSAVHVGHDTAAAVVRAGHHGDQLPRRIHTGGQAGRRHRRKAPRHIGDRARIEVDTVGPGFGQARLDRRGHHVAGCEITHRMHPSGHRIALCVNQYRPFAAQGLGDQGPPPACGPGVEHGRVELHELDVADGDARPHRQCHPVTRRAIRVGGGGIQVA